MKLRPIPHDFSICQCADFSLVDFGDPFCFTARTDDEFSLVCRTEIAPANTIRREDGWRAFFIEGPLDLSLIGILAKISSTLAENGIVLFAVSTYNTDYFFTRAKDLPRALAALEEEDYEILG